MPRNMFKIYDGRNYFWQWDTNQKLIVLDDTIDEVHFSNKDMTHAIPKDVCVDKDGKRVCYIPDALLTLPKNIVASAYVTDDNANKTLRSVKFAVRQRPIPSDYVVTEDFEFKDFNERLDLVEEIIEDSCFTQKFDTLLEAERWAKEHQEAGSIISVNVNSQWAPYIVNEDYSITSICNMENSAGGSGDGSININFQTDETLTFENGVLSVNTTDIMEQDNTLPMTSAGVFAAVGNIEALLKTI